MRKDRTIISELQEFFLQNDAHGDYTVIMVRWK